MPCAENRGSLIYSEVVIFLSVYLSFVEKNVSKIQANEINHLRPPFSRLALVRSPCVDKLSCYGSIAGQGTGCLLGLLGTLIGIGSLFRRGALSPVVTRLLRVVLSLCTARSPFVVQSRFISTNGSLVDLGTLLRPGSIDLNDTNPSHCLARRSVSLDHPAWLARRPWHSLRT